MIFSRARCNFYGAALPSFVCFDTNSIVEGVNLNKTKAVPVYFNFNPNRGHAAKGIRATTSR